MLIWSVVLINGACGNSRSADEKSPVNQWVSADLGQKWMCVSVSVEWVWGN